MNVCGGRFERSKHQRWLVSALVAVAVWAAPLGVAQPAGADADTSAENAPDASAETAAADADQRDASAGGVEVVRYAGSDPYEMSLTLANALVDAGDGSSEWAVLASGESWADAAAAGPLAASLNAPVILVPPGGLQSPSARPDLVQFLRSTGTRRVVIVGDPDVLPNHEPSVLFGLGMLPRNIERVHGIDPIGTSVAVAERLGNPAELGKLGRAVIIASEQSVADAVALGPLAAAGPFPLLLTAPDALDPRIAAYLTEQEIEHVVLVGGAAAIGPDVQDAIEATGTRVTRLAGQDRYHTAALAMDLLADAPRCADDTISNIGLALADKPRLALTTGRLLGPQCIPLLFTDADRLAPVTQNHLYLYRTGIEPNWHLIGNDVTIDPSAIEHPPVRMATVADNPDGNGQHIAVLDEHHQARHYLVDAGFDGITYVQWASDRSVIDFGAIRGDEGQEDDYELDTRSGIARLRATPAWYAHLAQDGWLNPRPSPDQRYIVFQARIEDEAGHSLLAVDAKSGDARWLTDNRADDLHHVVSSRWSSNANWLPDGRRLIYAVQDAAQTTNGCSDVPVSQAHVVDVDTGAGHRLEFDGYAVGDALLLSPDGTRLVVQSYPGYELAPAQDDWSFWTFNCVYFGTGSPVLTVFDLRGPKPLRIAGSGLGGHDPEWSPDGRRFVFRAPTEPHQGHSLFAADVELNSVSRLTINETDDVHHVVSRWLADNDRLMYSVMRIEELEGECGGWPYVQVQRSRVPHAQMHIVDLEEGDSIRLPYAGYVLGSWDHGDLNFSPDGRYLVAESHPSYRLNHSQGACTYAPEGLTRLHIFDLSGSTQQELMVAASHGYGGVWSPDSTYLAYHRDPLHDGSPDVLTIRDMLGQSEWTLEPTVAPDEETWVSFSRWSPYGSRILIQSLPGSSWGRYGDIEFVAVPETRRLIRLELPREGRSSLTLGSFSPDGRQLLRAQEGFYSDDIGTMYINDIADDGTLLGTFRTFAATEPSSAPQIQLEGSHPHDEYFDMISLWTIEGIFAASYFYWQPYSH